MILELSIPGCRIHDQHKIVVALNAGVVDEALGNLAVRRIVLELEILPFGAKLRRVGIVEDIAQRLETLTTDPTNSQLLQALTVAPDLVGKEVLAAITVALSEGKVICRSLDDWLVVQINALPPPGASRTAAGRSIRR